MLGGSAAALEEARADVMGIWSMLYMVGGKGAPGKEFARYTFMFQFDNGRLDAELRNKSLFTYITSLLRSARFGTDSSQVTSGKTVDWCCAGVMLMLCWCHAAVMLVSCCCCACVILVLCW